MNTTRHPLITAAALLFATAAISGADPDLQRQLKAAEDKNDRPAAAEICRRIVEADPGNLAALRKLVRTSLDLGDQDTTRRFLADLRQSAGPDDPGVLEAEGDLLARDQKPDQAVAAWQAALRADGDNAALLAKLGNHFLATGDGKENAAHYFKRLLALRASAVDHIIVAEAAAARRDWNTVIERTVTLKQDFAADPGAKRAVPPLERLIDSVMTIAALDKQIAVDLPPVASVLARGLLFRELGFPEIGLVDARRALRIAPDALYVRLAYAIIGGPVPREHERIGNWGINPGAFRSRMPGPEFIGQLAKLEDQLRANPGDGAARLKRAELLFAERQQSLAIADIDAALAANADDAQALRMKAEILRDMGKFGQAVPLIERALALQPDDPPILRAGISIFAAQGEYQRAIDLCDAYPTSADPRDRKERAKQRTLFYERLQQPPPAKP